MMPHIDLHSHSSVSDGSLTPTELVKRAYQNGVETLALTDHDVLDGVSEAKVAANHLGVNLVPGVEVSITWEGISVHIVGLHIDENDSLLKERLYRNRDGRQVRAARIAERLAELGIEGTFEGAMKYVTNPGSISRKHFGLYLVEAGVCSTKDEAFDRYLEEGRPAYVEHGWATLTDSVKWIHEAGGIAVIAHPGRYDLNDISMQRLLQKFKDLGGEGLEVVSGNHTPDQNLEFARLANRYGLLASVGSDFHAPGESALDVGCLPDFPCSVDPIYKSPLFMRES